MPRQYRVSERQAVESKIALADTGGRSDRPINKGSLVDNLGISRPTTAEQKADAVAYLTRHGCEDLIEVLGL